MFDLIGHNANIASIAVSADGRRILTAAWDGSSKLWEATTGQEVLTLTGSRSCFSSAGHRIATISINTVRIWTAASPEQMATWHKEDDEVRSRLEHLRRNP